MSHPAITHFVRRLRRQAPAAACRADHDLLERFTALGDETAFAALVQRHGPMVRGLCRRLLGDPGQADDVFQATFLVLARRAASIRRRESVGSFLYGVARRLAHKAQRGAARRRRHESRAAEGRPRPSTPDAGWVELLAILDEELARLPEQARAPLLLCYLEGYTQDEAARFLGWSVGTLRRRLERGRELLRLRLTRRGATLSAGLFAAFLAPRAATAAVSDSLVGATARAAVEFAASKVMNSEAAALAQTALVPLWSSPLKALALFLLTLGLVTAGVGARLYQAPEERPADPPAAPRAPEEKPAPGMAAGDRLGDPLPEGALVRFGTTRFRHPGGISGADLAPDGKVIVTAGHFGLRLIDTGTGRMRLSIPDSQLPEGYTDGMRLVAFSPDGKHLLVAGEQGARLLDPATGKQTSLLGEGRSSTRCVAFSPDGKQIAVSEGGGVALYEAATGKRQRLVPPGSRWLVYAPDSRRIALNGVTETMIRICDAATGEESLRFDNGSDVVMVAFAPDGKTLAVVGKDRIVRVWDTAGRAVHAFAEDLAEPARDSIAALAFSPDGKVLAAGTGDDSIRLWDPATGKALHRLRGHTWMITGLFFSRDGKTLYSTSWDSTVRRWDVAAGKEIRGPENDFDQSHMALSADGKLLASGGADGTISVWEAATGRRLRLLEGQRRGGFGLAFSPDGRRLASGGWERTVRVWDVAGGKQDRALDCGPGNKNQGRVQAVAFSPDGRLLAACDSGRGVVHLWDAGSGVELRELAHLDPAAVAFAPDGKTLATGGWDGALVLWDVSGGRMLRTIHPGDRPTIVDAVAFSPDGRLIATGHHAPPKEKTDYVYLWDATTGELVRQIEAGHQVTWCLAFSPDGRWLATGGLDRTVRLWEVATGRRMHQLRGHEFWVLRLVFDPDGRTLATGGYDGTSLLWSLRPKLDPLPAAGVWPLWEALLGPDAASAYRAAWTMAEHPEASVAYLKKHLRSVTPPIDRDRLRQWLADLDSDAFDKREAASRELAKLGGAAEPAIRAARAKATSPEARRRLEALLRDMKVELTGEALRQSRAVGVLELMANREAVELLRNLAKGPEEDPLRRAAEAALERRKR
jgi:RNA polymerase sigma factor (sigma-70 family)